MVRVKSTDEASPASVSIGKQLKGHQSEQAALDYFQYELSGYELLAQNQRVIGVEVDLLFQKAGVIHVVEVKTYREGFPLISKTQLKRLKRVAVALSSRHRSSVRLHLVSVETQAVLTVHWDIGDEV